MNILIQLDT